MNDKILKAGEIRCHAFQNEINLSRQHVTLADDRPRPGPFLKGHEVRFRLTDEPDHRKGGEFVANLLLVKKHAVTLDDTGFLQRANPAQTWRRRYADPAR